MRVITRAALGNPQCTPPATRASALHCSMDPVVADNTATTVVVKSLNRGLAFGIAVAPRALAARQAAIDKCHSQPLLVH
ncbi:MAG: hypothetical protein ACT4P6_15000 [Gemmatimonadaceae bacterium]